MLCKCFIYRHAIFNDFPQKSIKQDFAKEFKITTFYKQFEPRDDEPNCYEWETQRPIFTCSKIVVFFSPDGDCYYDPEKPDELVVVARDIHGNGFGKCQENAWLHLLENKESIEKQLRQSLREGFQLIYSEFIESIEEYEEQLLIALTP